TTFPLLICSIAILIYLFSTKNNSRVILIIGIVLLCGLLIGYSSSKRGIYFMLPLFLVGSLFLSIVKIGDKAFFKKKVIGFTIMSILISPLILLGITNSHGLN